jgi:putative two-component system response regulator
MGLKILVVDDDMINRKLLQMILKKNPMISEIIEVKNGSEALDIVEKVSDIDLILLDIMMPILDGVGFLKIFRADSIYTQVPVIVLSTDDSRKSEVLDIGANDFLRKPIKEDDLFAKIKQWL